MGFFIDEFNFFSGIDLFKDKPNYQTRDEIETKISKILPYKHTINVEGSNIKVEVFHSDVTDAQLTQIETVINDTFKVCQKYEIVPDDTDANFRMFLLENREQYVDIRNSLYNGNVPDTSMGVTVFTQSTDALSDMLVYRGFSNQFPFESDSFDKINYFTLSHEFVHCMQNMARQNSNAIMSKPVLEGSANSIACEALYEEKGVSDFCYFTEIDGIKAIKSEDIKLNDIYFNMISDSTKTVKDPYSTGMVMFKFFSERHPELIEQLSEYLLDGDKIKSQALTKKVMCINDSEEFTNWINNFPSSTSSTSDIKAENPCVTSISSFLFVRHPEMLEQLSELFLDSKMGKMVDFGRRIMAIKCSGEFTNWIDDQDTQCTTSMDMIHGLTSVVDLL